MKIDILLGSSAGLLSLSAFGTYNLQIIAGSSVPNTATWTLWAFLTTLNFASYLHMSKDWMKSILPAISSFSCMATFLFALYGGKLAGLKPYDMVALFLGIVAGLAWWRYKSSVHAQVILQIALLISFVPTYLGVWENPFVESPAPWFMWASAYFINTIIVIHRWSGKYRDLMNPINLLVLHGGVGVLAIPALRVLF